jgi:hypothetical protein
MENEFKYKLGSKVCVETSHSSNLILNYIQIRCYFELE